MAAEKSVDTLIAGGGPAGVSAALMAYSLGIDFVLVDPIGIGGRLQWIPRLINYPGASSGPALANLLDDQVRATGERHLIQARVAAVEPSSDFINVTLGNDRRIRCRHLVWATGITSRSRRSLEGVSDLQANETEVFLIGPNFDTIAAARSVLVLGCDRPLGTLLRDRPQLAKALTVVCFPGEDYKAQELQGLTNDVTMLPATHVQIRPDGSALVLLQPEGTVQVTPALIVTNLGSVPNLEPLLGLIEVGTSGYITEVLDPRVSCVGDVAHASHQRISVAIGDGARAVLDDYYRTVGAYKTPD